MRALAWRLREGLADIPAVALRTPLDEGLSAGLVCCEVEGRSPTTFVARLLEEGVVASAPPYAARSVRFGPSIVDSEEDDRALAAMRVAPSWR